MKRIKFEVDGQQHMMIMMPIRGSMMKKLSLLADGEDGDDGDWGIEDFVQSIDGKPPEESEVQFEAFSEAVLFLGKSFSRIPVPIPAPMPQRQKRKRKRKRKR